MHPCIPPMQSAYYRIAQNHDPINNGQYSPAIPPPLTTSHPLGALSMALHSTNSTPIHLAPASGPSVGIPPVRYVLMIHTSTCDCCHRTATHSEVYAETHLASRLERGKYITNLRPVQWPSRAHDALYSLPIIRRETRPTSVPFCHLCNSPSLSHWPAPPQPADSQVPLNSSRPTIVSPPREPKKTTEPPAAKPKGRSLSSILDML